MNDAFKKFRMEIRLISEKTDEFDNIIQYTENEFGEEEEEEDDNDANNDDEDQSNQKFYNRLSKLFEENREKEIIYFTNFFYLSSPDPLLEAITSIPNFLEFLKVSLLSENKFARFNTLIVIMLITYLDIDYSTLADPQVLEYLLRKLDDDFYYYRFYSLKVINNMIIQYNDVYQFFSENNFAEQLKRVANFRKKAFDSFYKQAHHREAKILGEIAYTIYVITKEKLISLEEAPIIWDTAIFVFNKGAEMSAVSNIIGSLGLITRLGYLGPFPDDLMNYFTEIAFDGVDNIKSFRFLLQCLPDPYEFFEELIGRGILDYMVETINDMDITEDSYNQSSIDKQRSIQGRVEFIYLILSDLKFASEDPYFINLTFEKVKGPYHLYTRDAIIIYLTNIINPESTNLIQEIANQEILSAIDDLLAVGEEQIVISCLNFVEVLLNCYSEGFQKEPSTFPKIDIIESDILELLTVYSDQTDDQIDRIVAMISPQTEE